MQPRAIAWDPIAMAATPHAAQKHEILHERA